MGFWVIYISMYAVDFLLGFYLHVFDCFRSMSCIPFVFLPSFQDARTQ